MVPWSPIGAPVPQADPVAGPSVFTPRAPGRHNLRRCYRRSTCDASARTATWSCRASFKRTYWLPSTARLRGLVSADPPPTGIVGKHFWFLPPERLPAADMALRRSNALDIAGQLVTPPGLDHALSHVQIALNYPPLAHRPGGPHLDGHRPDQDRPDSFTMLAAIYLVDEQERQGGNLWVWSGSHLSHQQLFQERGACALLAVSGQSMMLDPTADALRAGSRDGPPRGPTPRAFPAWPQYWRQHDRPGPPHRLLPVEL